MWNLKYSTNEQIYETETDSQTYRTDSQLPRGRSGERGMNWEFEVSINRCKLLRLECINNKVLLYNTGNYMQSPEINRNEKEYIKTKNVYMCITESLCCTAETTYNNIVNQLQFSKRVNKAALQSYFSFSCVNSIF